MIQTGKLTSPLKTLFLSICLLLGFSLLAEGGARSAIMIFGRERLPSPSKGFYRYILELKLNRLEMLSSGLGQVDVIFLGSSMVHRGLNPRLFESEYQKLTGQNITAFNIGVPGFKSKDVNLIASILVKQYHPKLLIYGLSVRDLDGQFELADIPNNPWVRYQMGEFSPDGWLRDSSLAYQYFLIYRNWMKEDFLKQLRTRRWYDQRITGRGFFRSDEVLEVDEQGWAQEAIDSYKGYFLDPAYVEAVRQVLILRNQGTQVILVEMPVQPDFVQYYPRQWQDQEDFLNSMNSIAIANNSLFWMTAGVVDIPKDGWYTKNHLNLTGADFFTAWLARQVAGVINN